MDYEAIIAEKELKIAQIKADYDCQIIELKHQIAQLQKYIFGRKSERYVPQDQQLPNLFSHLDQPQILPAEPEQKIEQVTITRKKNENKNGRTMIPAIIPEGMPVIKTYIEPENLPSTVVKIGEEISNQLGYKPGSFYVIQTIRPKYVDRATEQIYIAPKPPQAIDRCEADTSLLSRVVVSKFVDHLPEYRQIQMFKRDGIDIPSSTMNGWTHQVANYITPLVSAIQDHIMKSQYIQMDESTIRVLKSDHHNIGYMWVINDPVSRMCFFEFNHSRSATIPKDLLKDYQGSLQSDGYEAYKSTATIYPKIDHYGCMAHSRRKFVEAENNDKDRSQWMIKKLQQLYQIEQRCRDQNFEKNQRKELRAKESIPILNEIKLWLDTQSLIVTPRTPMGNAMAYMIKNWQLLSRYATTGHVEIDNNLVENAIRPLALGRKNYLFAGSPDAAVNIAKYYTIFSSCKALDIDPYLYLKWVLDELPKSKISDILNFTPLAYKTNMGKVDR